LDLLHQLHFYLELENPTMVAVQPYCNGGTNTAFHGAGTALVGVWMTQKSDVKPARYC
jgi:hypothetical protein